MYNAATVVRRMEALVRSHYLHQATAPATRGTYVSSDGVASGSHGDNALFLAAMIHCYFDRCSSLAGDPDLRSRIDDALRFQLSLVEPTGLIDLVSTNWQSPPDTAFTVQLLAPLVELAANNLRTDGASGIRESLLRYVRRAAEGITGGGFHTPNHRWVVASALAFAQSLVPDPATGAYIDSILAEGVDVNDDGEFSERSTGVYTAVSDRSLLILADRLGRVDLLDAVRASLRFMDRLFHPDGSVVTSMSRRQDRNLRVVPQEMADVYAIMGQIDGNAEWLDRAGALERASRDGSPTPWLLYPFLRFPELRDEHAVPARPAPAPRYEVFFADSGLHRIRDGNYSCTIMRGDHALLDLLWHDIHLSGARFAGTWFGKLRFVATSMTRTQSGVRLAMEPEDMPPAAYYLPLGRRVPFETVHDVRPQRESVELPRFAIRMDVETGTDGLSIHVTTSGGIAGVPCQIELCAEGELTWETPHGSVSVGPGSAAILKEGYAAIRDGSKAVRVGAGGREHRMWRMRGADPSCGGFRVVVPMMTPVDRTLTIEHGFWFEPEDRFMSVTEARRAGVE